jgi:hypothetical protein
MVPLTLIEEAIGDDRQIMKRHREALHDQVERILNNMA